MELSNVNNLNYTLILLRKKHHSKENELTDGTSNFFTSAAARFSFNNARLGVSSHCIRTCKSSDKCSQLGFPRFASSYKSEMQNSCP